MCCPNGSVEMATADDCRSEALITAPLHRVFVLLLSLSVARPLLLLLAISLQAKDNRGLATFRKHWFFLPWLAPCGSERTTILAASGIDSSTRHFESGSLQWNERERILKNRK
jgi:hypothetical protein